MKDTSIGKKLNEIADVLGEEIKATSKVEYAWYVGATGHDDSGVYTDFSDLYINENRWENRNDSSFFDQVKSIKIGDYIALKSSYTKKKKLPFNNNGKVVSVMAIKAIGTVISNENDGKNIGVRWEKIDDNKEWYGSGVVRNTISKVSASDGIIKKMLLQFTFENVPQDYTLCEDKYSNEMDNEDVFETKEIVIDKDDNNLTIDQLGEILSDMYRNKTGESKTTAIHMFGLKYADQILKNNYTSQSIVKSSGIPESYHAEVSLGIRMYKSILNNEYSVFFADNDLKKTNLRESLVQREPLKNSINSLNTILYGSPGTGKTYSTPEYAIAIIENETYESIHNKYLNKRKELLELYSKYLTEGKIVFTTFHQSYGYEDFIQGLRPDIKSGEMKFNLVDGIFKELSNKAMNSSDNYVIIIDEINRGNISKIFGELITLIEDNKRWGEEEQLCATLPSGEMFAVPNNLYILGTMNSADKSISLVDAALRRRFNFIEMSPDINLVDKDFRNFLEAINNYLIKELRSKDLLIGHSYFMNKTIDQFADIVNKNIIPLLYEYFFDDETKVKKALNAVTIPLYIDKDKKEFVYEIEESTTGRIKYKVIAKQAKPIGELDD